MIFELKTKTRLISNRRNRTLLTLVSPVWWIHINMKTKRSYQLTDSLVFLVNLRNFKRLVKNQNFHKNVVFIVLI